MIGDVVQASVEDETLLLLLSGEGVVVALQLLDEPFGDGFVGVALEQRRAQLLLVPQRRCHPRLALAQPLLNTTTVVNNLR